MKKLILPLFALAILASCGGESEEALTVCQCLEAEEKNETDLKDKCQKLAEDMGKKKFMDEAEKCGSDKSSEASNSPMESVNDDWDADMKSAQEEMDAAMEAASKEWDAAREYAKEEMDAAMEEAQKEVDKAMKEAQNEVDKAMKEAQDLLGDFDF